MGDPRTLREGYATHGKSENIADYVKVRWAFDDDVIRDGWTDFSTWNGFDNIWLDKKTYMKLYNAAKKDSQYFEPESWPEAPDENGLYSLAGGFTSQIRGFETNDTFVTNPFTDESGRFLVDPVRHYEKTPAELARIFGRDWRKMKNWV